MTGMDHLPAPPVAAECDLRDFPFLPLDVARLRDSGLAGVDDAEGFRAAVLLWCAAWHQLPGGSLPDADAELGRLAGYGRDTKMWRRAKAAGALRGWVQHADGRLYHQVVSEKAAEAWARKLKQRERSRKGNDARWGGRDDGPNGPEGGERTPSHGPAAAGAAPSRQHVNGHPAAIPDAVHQRSLKDTVKDTVKDSPNDPKGQGQWKGQGKEISPPASPKPARDAAPLVLDAWAEPEQWAPLAEKWETSELDGIRHPYVGGYHLDTAAQLVAAATGVVRTDWRPLAAWLSADLDLHEQILPALKAVAARPGYKPPRFLSYFDAAVRERRAA